MTRSALFFLLLFAMLPSCGHGAHLRPATDPIPTHPSVGVAFPNWAHDKTNVERMNAFSPLFDGRHVVYLGEPDHYIHEKYAYQLFFTTWLFERGFRHVGFEMGRSQAKRVDRYIESGDEHWLSVEDEDKKAMPTATGLLQFDTQDGWARADGEERRRFFQALRDVSEGRPKGTPRMAVFGFDVDFYPTIAFRDIRRVLSPENKHLEPLRELLDRAQAASGLESVHYLEIAGKLLHDRWQELSAEIGGKEAFELEADMGTLAGTIRFQRVAMNSPSLQELMAAYAVRERTMFWLLDRHLKRSMSEGTVLIGHNMHLSKHSETVGFGPKDHVAPMWPSIGNHVRENRRGSRARDRSL